jgi:predicted nucleic acid-binding protein
MHREQPSAYLDASFIVRYLTGEPTNMARRAVEVIDGEQVLIVTESMLAESAFVLASVYQIPRPDLVDALMAFVQKSNIRMAHLPKATVLDALRLCRNSKRYSFADVLLWAKAFGSASKRIYSFDERFPSNGIDVQR